MRMILIPEKDYLALQHAVSQLKTFCWIPGSGWRGTNNMKGCLQPISEVVRTAAAVEAKVFAQQENLAEE